jgi:hypothetical protein
MKITIKVPQEMIRVAGDRAILRGEEGEAQVHISALNNKAIARHIVEQLDVLALRAGKERPISISEASRRYGVPKGTISKWIGLGKVGKVGHKRWRGFGITEVWESDVAVASAVYNLALKITGSTVRAGLILRHAIDMIRERH